MLCIINILNIYQPMNFILMPSMTFNRDRRKKRKVQTLSEFLSCLIVQVALSFLFSFNFDSIVSLSFAIAAIPNVFK